MFNENAEVSKMQATNNYFRIGQEVRCCLNCQHFERYYTTEDEKSFYPSPAGGCTRAGIKLRGVSEVCRGFEMKREPKGAIP